jgi:mRNA-degrading endonuclease RelE of RelBE toxin-antitoxin system
VTVVLITAQAQEEYQELSPTMTARVLEVFEQLRAWPNVSGVKWLRYDWAGHARKRTGDWRVIFKIQKVEVKANDKKGMKKFEEQILIVKIDNRRDAYEGEPQ